MIEQIKQGSSRRTYLIIAITVGVLIVCIFILAIVQRLLLPKERQIAEIAESSIHVFQKLSDLTFETAEGKEITLGQKDNTVFVLIYWTSWCPHCVESLEVLPEIANVMEEAGAAVYIVNKLDGEKETKEQALQFLQEKGIERDSLFDTDFKNYTEIGLHMVPTTIVIDKNMMITSVLEGSIPNKEQAISMITEAGQGKANTLADKIKKSLLREDGGLHTTYQELNQEIPSGSDVLSESQGILMEYAARRGDKELFEQAWKYVQTSLFQEGLAPWVVTGKEDTKVNALVDDLRIVGGLQNAQEKWDGYQEAYKHYLDAIYQYNTENDNLVDFYDVEFGMKAERFTLCYGDLQVLSEMKKADKNYREVYKNTLERIQNGKISEGFPFYYNYYDYKAQKYVGGNLHMAEALTTLLHLAQVDELPPEALDWLDKRLEEGCIYAVYDTEGRPASEGRFESTAVYALTAMIAIEAGREDLAGKAITRMEQFKVQDNNNPVNGLFGEVDGGGIYSFDQGMALLAYERFERSN